MAEGLFARVKVHDEDAFRIFFSKEAGGFRVQEIVQLRVCQHDLHAYLVKTGPVWIYFFFRFASAEAG